MRKSEVFSNIEFRFSSRRLYIDSISYSHNPFLKNPHLRPITVIGLQANKLLHYRILDKKDLEKQKQSINFVPSFRAGYK